MTRLRNAPAICACLAAGQFARLLTQYYDHQLAAAELTTGQFSVLAHLEGEGPMSVAELAKRLLLDRKSLGLALRPLQRDGLVSLHIPACDQRRREIHLTVAGRERFVAAQPLWQQAQQGFIAAQGADRAKQLRKDLRAAIEAMEDAGLTPPGRVAGPARPAPP